MVAFLLSLGKGRRQHGEARGEFRRQGQALNIDGQDAQDKNQEVQEGARHCGTGDCEALERRARTCPEAYPTAKAADDGLENQSWNVSLNERDTEWLTTSSLNVGNLFRISTAMKAPL